MIRPLLWSVIALAVIVVAFFVVPWVITQTSRVKKPYRTKTGRVLTDVDIEAFADEAARGHEDLDKEDGPHNRPTV